KELQSRITALRKSISGGASDKTKKKQVLAEIALLEQQIQQSKTASNEIVEQVVQTKKKNLYMYSQEQERNARIEQEFEEAMQEGRSAPNLGQIESQKLHSLLDREQLSIHRIVPDGHCMYNAIADQLNLLDLKFTQQQLRAKAATYMRSHPEDFLPFLMDEQGNMVQENGFEAYLHKLEHEPVWGGQLELQALSCAFEHPICVYQADTIINIGEHFTTQPLRVSYHKHEYGLGEHYNSV
ncbi:hypothetical protein EDD86DRAFT_179807, partial [Gorgonomyces haynaldii]